jgi:hypothetical protein
MTETELIKRIQDALGTGETGEALIEVARNAHRAEMELASTYNWDDDQGAMEIAHYGRNK